MEPGTATVRVRCAGGIVLSDGGTIALINHNRKESHWLFPKGHLDANETDEETARREIAEETGLAHLEYLDDLGHYERFKIAHDGSEDRSEFKTVHMFLFNAEQGAVLAPTHEVEAAAWVPYREVAERLTNLPERNWYASVFERVRQAIQRD